MTHEALAYAKKQAQRIAELEFDNANLKAVIDRLHLDYKELESEVAALRVDAEKMDALGGALDSIRRWCAAYPIDVFTEPDWDEAKRLLGPTLLTQVSAANMRHVCDGIQRIIDAAMLISPRSEHRHAEP